ncbi:class I SAM-dependent methyltransferase [Pseudanabaena sp. UWO310]|uniref:class I SAM-dependent methyltransferase n=1 Tax=Pseudanabaena sp. UWO310 TaxID=2480795 RepID=UPI00115A160D|nr:class I SAM-dependent methyltransferase [Pseudanabaena sp. UWO310]TYQ25776.1 class I SAM-dependent methyltransferase [Pseudanabaena sp. UWO310]
MDVLSPLTKSSNVSLVEIIKTVDLVKIYKQFQFDITEELQGIQEIGLYHCDESDLYFFYPSICGSEKFYDHMQSFDWYYLDDKNEYEYASKFIRESDSVLEIGCGKGAFASKMSAKKYIGLEFSRKASKTATALGITVLNQSIQVHESNHSEEYDVVCSFQVLEHVSNIDSFIKSSLRCLKPNGLLIFSVPSFDSFSRYTTNFSLDMPPHHVTRWTDKALSSLVKYFDIELLEILHEPLQLAHRQMYIQAILRRSLTDSFKQKVKNIDFTWNNSIVSFIGKGLNKILAQGLSDPIFSPRGISVLAVYRKVNT